MSLTVTVGFFDKLKTSEFLIPPWKTGLLSTTSSPTIYSFIVVYQISTLIIASCLDVGHDLFFSCAMLEICAQVSILKHRFKKMMKNIENNYTNNLMIFNKMERKKVEKKIIVSFIENHLEIEILASKISRIFSAEIFLQFLLGGLMICVHAYHLSKADILSSEFFGAFTTLVGSLAQTAMICIVSNEVKSHVSHRIF